MILNFGLWFLIFHFKFLIFVVLLDGKKLSEKILRDVKEKAGQLSPPLQLAVVMTGEHPATLSFIKQKQKSCENVGIDFKFYKYPADITTAQLRKNLNKICKLKKNTGVIVQLPIPEHINKQYILNTVPPEKDVDVLSERSLGKFYTGRSLILPPTIAGIMKFLEEYNIEIKGKHVVIVGAGGLVGKPLATHLINQKATVISVNETTPDISHFTKDADILVTGVGKPNLVTCGMIKESVVVIDAGLAEANGKITGDVDFESVSKKASYLTPVPGGVGPVTVAMLLQNLHTLSQLKHKK